MGFLISVGSVEVVILTHLWDLLQKTPKKKDYPPTLESLRSWAYSQPGMAFKFLLVRSAINKLIDDGEITLSAHGKEDLKMVFLTDLGYRRLQSTARFAKMSGTVHSFEPPLFPG
jgi:hypothetical protein